MCLTVIFSFFDRAIKHRAYTDHAFKVSAKKSDGHEEKLKLAISCDPVHMIDSMTAILLENKLLKLRMSKITTTEEDFHVARL